MTKSWFDRVDVLPPYAGYPVHRGWYETSDGEEVVAYTITPKRPNGQVLFYLRGGTGRIGDVRLPRLMQFAAKGFHVVAPVYRGNHGGTGKEDFGGADLEDVVSLYDRVSRTHETIHALGFSRGGMMALSLASKRPVTSVTSWAGVTNLEWTYEEQRSMRKMLRRMTGGDPAAVHEAYVERSPLFKDWQAPTLLIHGTDDEQVRLRHATALADKIGSQAELWILPFAHQLPFWEKWKTTDRAMDWMLAIARKND
ncbi:S9 family peptidase [Exiguobacterium sp. SH3S2]|uniref:alpha/beta hydrolase family protein n=1 Tax=unclassified Exiguobacterium TaxID=2644629 RepID=UPI00103CE8E9|nr:MULTISPECIES: alpha/beta fold hydrolase [unclassified Exiguobacterium]TCI48863.1 S9 family peptidase [Exiguobacterium sp. SH3S3]TCI56090.1 S9 family peptidase [Exiguobacterium sp. SH5S13]TCI63727.1 S9 family peptidase [Exiguobacterium sp. SH3S2]